jgi:hypothetical protein
MFRDFRDSSERKQATQHNTTPHTYFTGTSRLSASASRHGFSAKHVVIYDAQKARQHLVAVIGANQEAQTVAVAQRLLAGD